MQMKSMMLSKHCQADMLGRLIVRKVLRTIDLVEFEQPGALVDTVNRAERRAA